MKPYKITFIYAYEGEEWSTPIALANEFKDRNWEVDFVSIGSNKTGHYHEDNLKKWVDSKPKTDIVLFMDWGRFDSPLLNKELVDAFWVQESGDDPQNFDRNSPKASRFHLTLTPDYKCYNEYKMRGINVEWLTHFADTKIHYPREVEITHVAVSSRGRGKQCPSIDYLVDYYGEDTIVNKNVWDPNGHSEFLCSGHMIIQESRWKEITRRIFEGMACGKLVITDRLPFHTNIDSLLVENQDIIYYDSIEELASKVVYFQENPKERELIAQRGRQKVLNNHTQVQWVDKIIEKWKDSQ